MNQSHDKHTNGTMAYVGVEVKLGTGTPMEARVAAAFLYVQLTVSAIVTRHTVADIAAVVVLAGGFILARLYRGTLIYVL